MSKFFHQCIHGKPPSDGGANVRTKRHWLDTRGRPPGLHRVQIALLAVQVIARTDPIETSNNPPQGQFGEDHAVDLDEVSQVLNIGQMETGRSYGCVPY